MHKFKIAFQNLSSGDQGDEFRRRSWWIAISFAGTLVDAMLFQVTELKQLCADARVTTAGTKVELVQRLLDLDAQAKSAAAPATATVVAGSGSSGGGNQPAAAVQ